MSEPDYYDLILLENDSETAQSLLEKAGLNQNQRYTIGEVLDILVEQEVLTRGKLNYVNMVMTTTADLTQPQLEDFRIEMACRTLRRLRGKWDKVEHSIEVFAELEKILPQPIEVSMLTNYIKALVYELLKYDGRRGYWTSLVGDEKRIGDKLNDKLEKQCAHYYGFKAFSELDPEDMDDFVNKIKDIEAYNEEHDEVFDEADERKKNLKKSIKAFRNAKRDTDRPWDESSPFARDGNESAWPMATQKFEDRAGEKAKVIRRFYDDFYDNI